MKAVLQEGDDTYQDFYFGDYKVKVMYEKPNEPSFGIVIHTDTDEFIVIGMNLTVYFTSEVKGEIGYIGHIPATTMRVRRLRDGFTQIISGKVVYFRNFNAINPNPIVLQLI
jgi:hypothetical protein